MEEELVALDGAAQAAFHVERAHWPCRSGGRRVEAIDAAPFLLGTIECRVRILDDFIRLVAIVRKQADAMLVPI